MAVTRREYIYACFGLSCVSVALIVASFVSNNWVVSLVRADLQYADSNINYGLFNGEIVLRFLATPTANPMKMTCALDMNACAPSCKTTAEARLQEVRALAQGLSLGPTCTATTTIDNTQTEYGRTVISASIYIILVALLSLNAVFATLSAFLALYNAFTNPTEPVLGIAGIFYCNIISAVLSFSCLMVWGIYWAVSSLATHLAFAYVAVQEMTAISPNLGYSYWLLLVAFVSNTTSAVLVEVRKWHLERERPPPTIQIEANSDGTIFLY